MSGNPTAGEALGGGQLKSLSQSIGVALAARHTELGPAVVDVGGLSTLSKSIGAGLAARHTALAQSVSHTAGMSRLAGSIGVGLAARHTELIRSLGPPVVDVGRLSSLSKSVGADLAARHTELIRSLGPSVVDVGRLSTLSKSVGARPLRFSDASFGGVWPSMEPLRQSGRLYRPGPESLQLLIEESENTGVPLGWNDPVVRYTVASYVSVLFFSCAFYIYLTYPLLATVLLDLWTPLAVAIWLGQTIARAGKEFER